MAVFWGMFAFSVIVIATITGLSIKLALLYRDRGELRLKLHAAEREALDANNAVKGIEAQMARYRKEIEVLREELDLDDADLDLVGVADRLERLLSGKVSEDSGENGEGRDSVPAPGGPEAKPGDV